jgi:predicted ATP-dependent serine protease
MNIVTTCTGFTAVSKIKIPDVYSKRFKTGCEDLDELFGVDGFIPGTTFTLAAPPGSGKTSILLQTLELLHHVGKSTAYVSGEESVYQLAFTCKRLNVQSTSIANMVIIEDIFDSIEKTGIDVVILDSFPSLRSREKIHGKRLEEYLSNYICTKAKELECVVVIVS